MGIEDILKQLDEETLSKIRRFLQLNTAKKHPKILDLFDLLVREPDTKPMHLVQNLYEQFNKKNYDAYRSLKRQLKQLIERYFFLEAVERDYEIRSMLYAAVGTYLIYFEHLVQGREYVKEAMELARDIEAFPLQLYHQLMYLRMMLRTEESAIEELYQNFQESYYRTGVQCEYIYYQRKILIALTREEFSKAELLYNELMEKHPDISWSKDLQMRRLAIEAWLYRYPLKHDELYQHLKKELASLSPDIYETNKYTEQTYLLLLCYFIESAIIVGDLSTAKKRYAELESFKRKSSKIIRRFSIFMRYYQILIDFYENQYSKWLDVLRKEVISPTDFDIFNQKDILIIFILLLYLNNDENEVRRYVRSAVNRYFDKRDVFYQRLALKLECALVAIRFEKGDFLHLVEYIQYLEEKYKNIAEYEKPIWESLMLIKEYANQQKPFKNLSFETLEKLIQYCFQERIRILLLVDYTVFLPLWIISHVKGISYYDALLQLYWKRLKI